MTSLKSFEELECWKACREVRKTIYRLSKTFPADERYGLVDDIRRAARSTTHNIAEGYGRFHFLKKTFSIAGSVVVLCMKYGTS